MGSSTTFLRAENLHKLLEILKETFVFHAPHLFVQLFLYVSMESGHLFYILHHDPILFYFVDQIVLALSNWEVFQLAPVPL